MGFGFVEVGTVTPLPQVGNDKPRLFRVKDAKGIINRMGFNNKGVDYLVEQMKRSQFNGVLGINIGKNKATPEENALSDYLVCLKKSTPTPATSLLIFLLPIRRGCVIYNTVKRSITCCLA